MKSGSDFFKFDMSDDFAAAALLSGTKYDLNQCATLYQNCTKKDTKHNRGLSLEKYADYLLRHSGCFTDHETRKLYGDKAFEMDHYAIAKEATFKIFNLGLTSSRAIIGESKSFSSDAVNSATILRLLGIGALVKSQLSIVFTTTRVRAFKILCQHYNWMLASNLPLKYIDN